MRLQKPQLKEWEYKTTDGQVRYLLAPNLEHAAWAAAELSGGTQFLKDCLLYTSPSPRDLSTSRMPSSA